MGKVVEMEDWRRLNRLDRITDIVIVILMVAAIVWLGYRIISGWLGFGL